MFHRLFPPAVVVEGMKRGLDPGQVADIRGVRVELEEEEGLSEVREDVLHVAHEERVGAERKQVRNTGNKFSVRAAYSAARTMSFP